MRLLRTLIFATAPVLLLASAFAQDPTSNIFPKMDCRSTIQLVGNLAIKAQDRCNS